MKNKMQSLSKISIVLTKIMEITHWVAAALMIAAAVCTAAAPQMVDKLISFDATEQEVEISTYGFEVTVPVVNGVADMKTVRLYAIGAVMILSLMAMVFRNLYLILKKSANNTPFQEDNVRMLREIGYFSIAIPIISLIMGAIIRAVIGMEVAELSVRVDGFVMGIIVLSLTQLFAHGITLEKDVDGLL